MLGNYESKACSIIDKIIKSFNENTTLNITKGDEEFLYKYMNLQYLRTDAGRINFISLFENLFSYVPRNKPIELKEIRSDENKIKSISLIAYLNKMVF